MLVASTGIRISEHWCGKQLVNSSIFGDAEPCAHYQAKAPCPNHANDASSNCCNQQETYIDGTTDDYQTQFFEFSAPTTFIVHAFAQFDFSVFGGKHKDKKFHNHSPPLIGPLRFLILETFRI